MKSPPRAETSADPAAMPRSISSDGMPASSPDGLLTRGGANDCAPALFALTASPRTAAARPKPENTFS